MSSFFSLVSLYFPILSIFSTLSLQLLVAVLHISFMLCTWPQGINTQRNKFLCHNSPTEIIEDTVKCYHARINKKESIAIQTVCTVKLQLLYERKQVLDTKVCTLYNTPEDQKPNDYKAIIQAVKQSS